MQTHRDGSTLTNNHYTHLKYRKWRNDKISPLHFPVKTPQRSQKSLTN